MACPWWSFFVGFVFRRIQVAHLNSSGWSDCQANRA